MYGKQNDVLVGPPCQHTKKYIVLLYLVKKVGLVSPVGVKMVCGAVPKIRRQAQVL